MDLQQRLRDLAISESGFVFDPFTGTTFSVNPTGQFILLKLREGADAAGIERELTRTFELYGDDDPARDVHEFLGLLREQGLVPKDALAPAPVVQLVAQPAEG
jgi:hypothetical protein